MELLKSALPVKIDIRNPLYYLPKPFSYYRNTSFPTYASITLKSYASMIRLNTQKVFPYFINKLRLLRMYSEMLSKLDF